MFFKGKSLRQGRGVTITSQQIIDSPCFVSLTLSLSQQPYSRAIQVLSYEGQIIEIENEGGPEKMKSNYRI